jgi:quercetin dioxygenase-like cupin family protein
VVVGTSSEPDTAFFLVDEHDWADDAATASVPAELLEEARRRGGGGRKLMAQGEGGFHSTFSMMPPGYAMAAHRHDRDELIVVVAGGATFGDQAQPIAAGDSVVVPAGVVHSFVCGPEGLQIVTVARGPASTELVAPS